MGKITCHYIVMAIQPLLYNDWIAHILQNNCHSDDKKEQRLCKIFVKIK